jgi:hypothetical protein
VHLAQNLTFRDAAIVEFEDGVGIATVADVAIAIADGEAGGALVDEEGSDQLLLAARGLFFPARHEADGEIGQIGMADEMLGAVQHPVIPVLPRAGLHAAQVGPRARFRHGKAIPFLAPDAGIEVFLPLLLGPCQQDVRRPRDAGPVQGVVGLAQFLFIEKPGQGIEARAPHLGRHVGGIEARLHGLGLNLLDQVHAQVACAFHLHLMGVKLVLDEAARRLDDHLLFFGQAELHGGLPYGSTL